MAARRDKVSPTKGVGLFLIILGAAVIMAAVADPLIAAGLTLASVGSALLAQGST
jgi:hypothetical protein